jgi:hypothetical protein
MVMGPLGMPGASPGRENTTRCPECYALALEMADGSYVCPNGHRFSLEDAEKALADEEDDD